MATWKDVASANFNAAADLRKKGWHRSSTSRAYYAAFSAILEMLGKHHVGPTGKTPSHKALPGLVSKHFGVNRQKAANRLKAWLRQSYQSRIWADYDPIRKVDESVSLDATRLAAGIIKTCERI